MRPEHLFRGDIDGEDIHDEFMESSLVAWSPEQEAEGQRAWLLQIPIRQNGKSGDYWTIDMRISAKKAYAWRMMADR